MADGSETVKIVISMICTSYARNHLLDFVFWLQVGIDVSCEGTMIVSGIPERSVTHASDMCTLSLHMLSTLLLSKVEYLELQIGISSGTSLLLRSFCKGRFW